MRSRAAVLAVAASLSAAACATEVASTPDATDTSTSTSTDTSADTSTSTSTGPDETTTTSAVTTTVAPSTTSSTVATTTSTVVPSTTAAPTNGSDAQLTSVEPSAAAEIPPNDEVVIGTSVEGRPITLIRRGTPGGTRILVVGVIHGNEPAGVAVVDRLRTRRLPAGIELFLVPSMNPDGQAADDRQNANHVDLNRNFPANWSALGVVGDWQYGGPSAASEPETKAMVELGEAIRPDLVFWYHQDLFRISPGNGRGGAIRTRFAELTGLPVVDITGGTYTGTAAQWASTVLRDDGVGITVELGETITDDEASTHAAAILTVATEYFGAPG
jgi:protein MpaA